jgi:hypothetical protein
MDVVWRFDVNASVLVGLGVLEDGPVGARTGTFVSSLAFFPGVEAFDFTPLLGSKTSDALRF